LRFNLEEGGRKTFIGNDTVAKIRDVLGDRWDARAEKERQQLVEDLMSIENHETMLHRAQRVWKLDEQEAEDLADVALEDGHANLSTKAIRKLLPFLEAGFSYTEARDKAYPERAQPPVVDLLPELGKLRNPMVQRARRITPRHQCGRAGIWQARAHPHRVGARSQAKCGTT
jgi:hypothetical protein